MKYAGTGKISSKAIMLRAKTDKAKTPECLQDNKKAEIFIGLTNALFIRLPPREREDFLVELGKPEHNSGFGLASPNRFTGDDIVQFATEQLDRRRIQAARIVGEMLGIKPEYCFDAFPSTKNTNLENEMEPFFLSEFIPPKIQIDNNIYMLSDVDKQYSFDGTVDQKICYYSNANNESFLLIAPSIIVNVERRKEKFIGIGYAPAKAWPFSRVAIDNFPSSPIIFPMSLYVAFHLRKMCREAKFNDLDGIVSGHFGNIDALDLHCFSGRKVILLAEFSREGYAKANEFASKIQSSVMDVRIYPWPIMAAGMSADAMTAGPGSTWKQAFLDQKVDLREELASSSFLSRVIAKALSTSDFKKRLVEVGLIAPEKVTFQENDEAPPPVDPALTPAKALNFADVTLYHTLRPGSIVMIVGAKSAGKTQLALSACRSIIKGNVMWPLFMGSCIDAGNVAYIDAETPHDEYLENLEQHDLARERGRRFWGISRFAPDLPEFCNPFSLNAKSFRDGLHHFLLRNQCRYIFLDNLTALMGNSVNHGDAAGDVLAWVENLQKRGLCVVFVHHKTANVQGVTQNDKTSGSQLFYIRSRTVISLVSKDEIRAGNLGTGSVKTTALQEGLTVGLHFKDCKPAPVLKDKTFWLYLPLGEADWQFLAATGADGQEIELPMGVATTGVGAANNKEGSQPVSGTTPSVPAEHDLSPDQRRVLEILKKGSAKREEIQGETGFGEDKTRDLLNSLIELGVASKEGQGKATYYVLKPTS